MDSGGYHGRKGTIVTLAVAVCMLSVSLFVSSDTDAYATGSDGYVIRIGADADSSELDEFGYDEYGFYNAEWDAILRMTGIRIYIGEPPIFGSHSLTLSVGSSLFGMKSTHIYSEELDFRNVRFVYNDLTGNIINPDFAAVYPEYTAAVNSYFGKSAYATGDELKITGNIRSSDAYKETYQYTTASGNNCLLTSESFTDAYNTTADVTFTFTPNGGVAKSITAHIDCKSYLSYDTVWDYGKSLSEVAEDDPVYVDVQSYEMMFMGSITVTVGDDEYSLGQFLDTPTSSYQDADLVDENTLEYDDHLSDFLNGKSPTSHISFSTGYSAADNHYNKIIGQFKGDESNITLIAVAGAAIAVVAVAALLLMRKKIA